MTLKNKIDNENIPPYLGDLFVLFVVPPYFCQLGQQLKRGEIRKEEWGAAYILYREELDKSVFSLDEQDFKKFAAENQHYFGERINEIIQLPSKTCKRVLEMILEERVKYEAEQMSHLRNIS